MGNSVAIVNGKLRKEKSAIDSLVRSRLENEGIRLLETQFPGHAKNLAQKERNNSEIIVVGGDGTLHEVLSSLKPPFPKIRLIPAGTGNSLARDFGWEKWNRKEENLSLTKDAILDLLQIDVRTKEETFLCYSASTISFGFPAAVTEIANSRFKKLKKYCYPVAAGIGVFFQKRKIYEVSYDSEPTNRIPLTGCILNNTRHVANFLAFPNAKANDGKLEVLELNSGIFGQTIHNLSVLSRKYFYEPKAPFQVNSVVVNFESPEILMVDGEIYKNVISFSVKVLRESLRLYGPR
ncbi:diacylglycerol kinase family protein [Leptospira venezuelensis]|uniref:diacylglycerol/lipid kinase family protein n=1 Tax=Leptospira venezuelensis TaxID=1958811 RepID=UPI000A3D32C8|nr:diacylglycerol kinase family protein [Leptospira venezuelensis]